MSNGRIFGPDPRAIFAEFVNELPATTAEIETPGPLPIDAGDLLFVTRNGGAVELQAITITADAPAPRMAGVNTAFVLLLLLAAGLVVAAVVRPRGRR